MSGYMPTASTARTNEPAEAFSLARCTSAMSPRPASAVTSCCRMPLSMLRVAPLVQLRWLNCRSAPPPLVRADSHPANARTTARWSDPPPASSEKAYRAAFPASLLPSMDMMNGERYAAAHATVSTGSRTPRSVAYRSIFPTRGCTGISPRCRPRRVRDSSSFNAPMS